MNYLKWYEKYTPVYVILIVVLLGVLPNINISPVISVIITFLLVSVFLFLIKCPPLLGILIAFVVAIVITMYQWSDEISQRNQENFMTKTGRNISSVVGDIPEGNLIGDDQYDYNLRLDDILFEDREETGQDKSTAQDVFSEAGRVYNKLYNNNMVPENAENFNNGTDIIPSGEKLIEVDHKNGNKTKQKEKSEAQKDAMKLVHTVERLKNNMEGMEKFLKKAEPLMKLYKGLKLNL